MNLMAESRGRPSGFRLKIFRTGGDAAIVLASPLPKMEAIQALTSSLATLHTGASRSMETHGVVLSW